MRFYSSEETPKQEHVRDDATLGSESMASDYKNFDHAETLSFKPGISRNPKYYHTQHSVLKNVFNGCEEEWVEDLSQKHSFVYVMLHPRSKAWQSEMFKTFITIIIVVDLLIFVVSTESSLHDPYTFWFRVAEGITSTIFLAEYIARLVTATENRRYREHGPALGRLRYMVTFPALIDLVATLPFFLNLATAFSLPTLTYLRIFRVLRILKTDGYARAFGACYRVIYYNREILYVALLVCLFLVLLTSVLLYYLKPPETEEYYENESLFRSIPATMYLSVLMLTGQNEWIRGSEGMPWYTKVVVGLTGALSVAMFAIPVSLLTWGFEAEAERCAKKARQSIKQARSTVSETTRTSPQTIEQCSSDEEYLKIIARESSDLSQKRNAQVKELVETFLKDDFDGRRNQSLSEFLANSMQSGEALFVNHEVIEIDETSDVRVRVQSLETTVLSMNSKLDRICRILEDAESAREII
jgi:voltage-gated potassium channel